MSIPVGLFARERLDEHARMVRDHVTEQALVREARRHAETTATPSTRASVGLVSIETGPNCSVRTASERPA
jgi:hypothetical protein